MTAAALSIEEAHRIVTGAMAALSKPCDTPLRESLGRVAACEVLARCDQPRFDSAAMDGWAVRESASGPSGAYRIVGESRAGHAFEGPFAHGEAIHVSTGAVFPSEADRLVRREYGRVVEGVLRCEVAAPEAVCPGRDIRRRGCDFREGDRLLATGRRIDHLDIARVAASGIGAVSVWRAPRVGLLATGDEIMVPGTPARPSGNYDALSPALWARLRQIGVVMHDLGIAGDDDAAIAGRAMAADIDVLVVIGGASGGRHDRVRTALDAHHLRVLVPGVRMRPGKPFWFGRCDDGRLVVGLPGNPVAALIAAELFLIPALLRVQGLPDDLNWTPIPGKPADGPFDKVRFCRKDGDAPPRISGGSDSAALSPVFDADALHRTGPTGTSICRLSGLA